MSQIPDYKEAATDFLCSVAAGRVREVFGRYVSAEFRHHSPFFKGDAASLEKAMEENAAMFPGKVLEIKHVLQDGELVCVHSRLKLSPTHPEMALVHLFRFAAGAIVELWDIGQSLPPDSPNEWGMF